MGNFGGRTSDLESDTSSLRPAPTPSQSRYASATPEPDGSSTKSPILMSPVREITTLDRPATPLAVNVALVSAFTPPDSSKPSDKEKHRQLDSILCTTPTTPKRQVNADLVDGVDNGVPSTPYLLVRAPSDRRKPTVCRAHQILTFSL